MIVIWGLNGNADHSPVQESSWKLLQDLKQLPSTQHQSYIPAVLHDAVDAPLAHDDAPLAHDDAPPAHDDAPQAHDDAHDEALPVHEAESEDAAQSVQERGAKVILTTCLYSSTLIVY